MNLFSAKIPMMYRILSFCLLVFLLASCGEEPKLTGNQQIVRIEGEPNGLNPVLMVFDRYSTQVIGDVFHYLMAIDPQTLKLEPVLIKAAPEVSEIAEGPFAGGAMYTFEVLDEAVWDDGEPITGNDYIFSVKTIMNPALPTQRLRGYFTQIGDIVIDPNNPKIFSVLMKEKYILAEEVLVGAVPMMPHHLYDPEGLMDATPLSDLLDPEVAQGLEEDPNMKAFAELFNSDQYNRDLNFVSGSGPYKVVQWETGQQVVLQKKENWWGDSLADNYSALRAYPEQIIYKPVPDVVAAATMTRDESFDIVPTLDSKDFNSMREDPGMQEKYEFYTPLQMMFYLTYLNNKTDKLSDKRVRRALAHLMDMDEIIETLFFGYGERTVGPIHPTKDYYHKDLPLIDYNPERASELLAEAGWADSNGDGTLDKEINGEVVELSLNYLTTQTPASQNIALLFIENARKVGVKVELITKDFQTWRSEMDARNYDMAGAGLGAQPILDDLYQIWHTDGDSPDGFNRMGFGNAKSDEVIEAIRETLDKEARDSLYIEIQEIIYDEQPVIFLLAPTGRILVHKRWDSFTSPVRPGYFPTKYQLN